MKFIATVEESEKQNIRHIAKSLQDKGIVVDQILKITGIITGSSNNLPIKEVKIKGIKSVETDRKVTAFR